MIYVVYFVYDQTERVLDHQILEEYSYFGPTEARQLARHLRHKHGDDVSVCIGTIQNGERQILLDTRTS